MRHYLFCLGLLLLSYSLLAQVDLNRLDAYFAKAQKDWNVPGMSIAIVKDGEMIFAKGYGTVEVGTDKKPDENTLYAIASNSKAFTTAAIATLVQEGKLNWDDKVQDYLPYFQLYDDYASKQTTIRDLLSHRVGLGTFSGDIIWYRSDLTAEEIIKRIQHLPQAYDFRAGYGYSNLMYITAGEIIKKVTGKKWGQYVRETFLEPLEMNRTITKIQQLDEKGNVATPHALEDGQNKPIPWVDWETVEATGGILSSVKDMSNWMIFNLNNGIWKGDTILTPHSRNILWMPHNNFMVNHINQNRPEMNFNGYALGWGVKDYHGKLYVGHSGGYDGMISRVALIPEENLGIVVLTNGLNSPVTAVVNYTIDAFLGLPQKDYSSEYLENVKARKAKDTRVADAKKARVLNTKPALPIEKYSGTFYSDIYGNIDVQLNADKQLSLSFEHTPDFDATLEHWHYNVWKINWKEDQAWFDFGTVQFDLDNNLNVTGLDFFVPNDDIFFYELKPEKVK